MSSTEYFSCSTAYRLTAQPNAAAGYVFAGWTLETYNRIYDLNSNPLTVEMETEKTATARFTMPPVADAGEDQEVNAGDQVTLDGSGSSDPDDGIQSYYWQQTAGPDVILSDLLAEKPIFTAPDVASGIIFELTVTDNAGAEHSDSVTITVAGEDSGGQPPDQPANQLPVAVAGDDQDVTAGDLVTLDGSASSDPDGDIRSYYWQQIMGTVVTLSEASAKQPTFTAPEVYASGNPIMLVFKLTVTDNSGGTAEAQVTILVYLEDSVSGGGCFISEALR